MTIASPGQDRRLRREKSPASRLIGPAGMKGGARGQEASAGPQIVTFRVEGMAPAPQGSKRHVGKGVMIESSKQVKPWRQLVTAAALDTGLPLFRGPVRLSIVFLFLRPRGHFGARGLKPSAPRYHAVRPDGSKLLRSTEDALTQVLYEDDARIVGCTWEKRWCVGDERPGALITVIPLGDG